MRPLAASLPRLIRPSTALYISTTTEAVSNLRSITYLAGVFTNFALLIRAGRALAANRF